MSTSDTLHPQELKSEQFSSQSGSHHHDEEQQQPSENSTHNNNNNNNNRMSPMDRMKALIPPVTLPHEVAEVLGEEVAANPLIFYGVVERQTTSMFKARKKIVVVVSYTSILFFEMGSGKCHRIIKIKTLKSPMTLNNSGFGSLVLRVEGENDALLYFVDSSKQGGLSSPEVSTIDNFLAQIKRLHRLYSPDKELLVEKVEKNDSDMKKEVDIQKKRDQPPVESQIAKLQENAESVKQQQREREAERKKKEQEEDCELLENNETTARLTIEEAEQLGVEEVFRLQKEEIDEKERLKQEEADRMERDRLWEEADNNTQEAQEAMQPMVVEGSNADHQQSTITDEDLYGTLIQAQEAEVMAREHEERLLAEETARFDDGDNDDSEVIQTMRANLREAQSALSETRARSNLLTTENDALRQTEKLLTTVVDELRGSLRDVQVEKETGLIGDTLQEQKRQIELAKGRKDEATNAGNKIKEMIILYEHEIQALMEEVEHLKLKDQEEFAKTDTHLVELSSNFNDPAMASGTPTSASGVVSSTSTHDALGDVDDDDPEVILVRERTRLSDENMALSRQLDGVQGIVHRKDQVLADLHDTQQLLEKEKELTAQHKETIVQQKSETLTPLMSSFQDALQKLESEYNEHLAQRIDREWDLELRRRENADAEAQEKARLELLEKHSRQESELNILIHEKTQVLKQLLLDNQTLVEENTALREMHESVSNDQQKLEGVMQQLTAQLTTLTKQAHLEKKNRVANVQQQIAGLENRFSKLIIEQHEELQRVQSEVGVMTHTVQMAHRATAQSPSMRRNITLDL